MAESILKTNNKDPMNINLIDDVDGTLFMEWRGLVQPIRATFYDKNLLDQQDGETIFWDQIARTPSPDTMLMEYKASSYKAGAILEEAEMESAPPIAVSTYFTVIADLYTRGTLIDPGQPPEPCTDSSGTTTSGCQPIAELEMAASPIASLDIDAAPLADLDMDDIPQASLTCKILL